MNEFHSGDAVIRRFYSILMEFIMEFTLHRAGLLTKDSNVNRSDKEILIKIVL